MKPKFFIRLNLVFTLVFLIAFVIILYSVNPFEANSFQVILFYAVLFGLILGILNLIGMRLNIPSIVRVLIAIIVILLLIWISKY